MSITPRYQDIYTPCIEEIERGSLAEENRERRLCIYRPELTPKPSEKKSNTPRLQEIDTPCIETMFKRGYFDEKKKEPTPCVYRPKLKNVEFSEFATKAHYDGARFNGKSPRAIRVTESGECYALNLTEEELGMITKRFRSVTKNNLKRIYEENKN